MSNNVNLTASLLFEAVCGWENHNPERAKRIDKIILIVALPALSVLVMGFVGHANLLSGRVVGLSVVGGALTSYGIQFAFGKLKERRIYIIGLTLVSATFVTLGTLGGVGILSASQVGLGVIGTAVSGPIFKLCFAWLNAKRREKEIRERNGTGFDFEIDAQIRHIEITLPDSERVPSLFDPPYAVTITFTNDVVVTTPLDGVALYVLTNAVDLIKLQPNNARAYFTQHYTTGDAPPPQEVIRYALDQQNNRQN